MGLFKSKFDKLTREEVVDSICQLEKELKDIEDGLVSKKNEINNLMEKGRAETDRDIKLFYAKRINAYKHEREESTKRAMYLLYNINLLNKLKTAIDDNQFFKKSAKISLGNLLKDQKGLAAFLNKTLVTRVKAEDVLTNADSLFTDIKDSYEENDSIYGTNTEDDALLSMFETEDQVKNEQESFAALNDKKESNEMGE